MNTPQFPAPKGIPAIIGAIQCTLGVQVHANIISPTGQQTAAMQTTATMASGGAKIAQESQRDETRGIRYSMTYESNRR